MIDPAKVGRYNTSDPVYQKYTASGWNIAVTPELVETARGIVGNETNPYRQAQKIYWYVISHPYSLVPHDRLNAMGMPESEYMLTTGFGDCGTQSMYFAALCRAVGIPARSTGAGRWSPATRAPTSGLVLPARLRLDTQRRDRCRGGRMVVQCNRYRTAAVPAGTYSENLDPYRYIIQKDVDIPLVPDPGNATTSHVGALQSPKVVCDTCTTDPELGMLNDWKVTLTQV